MARLGDRQAPGPCHPRGGVAAAVVLGLGVCLLTTCILPGEPETTARIDFSLSFQGPLTVAVADTVAPPLGVLLDSVPVENPAYRLESEDPSVVSVDASGRRLVGVSRGSGSVRAMFVTGAGGGEPPDTTFAVQVTVDSVAVAPAVHSLLELAGTVQLVAAGLDAAEDTIPGVEFSWWCADSSVVSVDSTGLVTALDNGTTSVFASADGVIGEAELTVAQPVGRVQVAPSTVTLTTVGRRATVTAVAFDPQNQLIDLARFDWSSSDTLVAVVDEDGVAEATGGGSAWIVADFAGMADSAGLIVDQAVAFVFLTPESAMLFEGQDSVFTAVALDSGSAEISDPGLVWASTDPSVATVSDGVVSAVAAGSAEISAEADGVADTTSVTVVTAPSRVEVAPLGVVLYQVGETVQLTAQAWDAFDTPMPGMPFVWTSSDPDVATVDAAGLVTAVTYGAVKIQAGTPGVAASGDVVVIQKLYGYWQVSAGSRHTCATGTADLSNEFFPRGWTLCWGNNEHGQLGDGTNLSRVVPWIADTANTVRAGARNNMFFTPAAGPSHACASGGSRAWLYCWGRGINGRLGSGGTSSSDKPVRVQETLSLFPAVVGEAHSCAFKPGFSTVACWGRNSDGQLGDGTTSDRWTPTLVAGGVAFGLTPGADLEYFPGAYLTAGSDHTCALAADSTAYCWGRGDQGQLGNAGLTSSVPDPVSGGLKFTTLGAGASHTCGVASDSTLYCWGRGAGGQIGDGGTADRNTPVAVTAGGLEFWIVTGGEEHTCALTTAGTAYCWGRNDFGQLGDGTNSQALTPVPVVGASGFDFLDAGAYHTCARLGDAPGTPSELFCWGRNDDGQLGDGTRTDSSVPVQVLGQ